MKNIDKLTPLERKRCLELNQDVDRLPISIIISSAAKYLFSNSLKQDGTIAENIAEVQIKIYKECGIDGLEVFYGLNTFGEILGAEMTQPKIGTPAIRKYPMKNIIEGKIIQPDDFKVEKEQFASTYMEAIKIKRERIGREVGCGMGFPGVFSAVASLIGIEKLLVATRKQPEELHALLKRVNACLINLAKDFLNEDIPVSISDPVASGTILSRKQFREFVLPYAQEFVRECKKVRAYNIGVHICGDTSKVLQDIVECGYGSVSLDNVVDLDFAKQKIGNRVHISGNVPPVEIMLLGSTKQVEASVKTCYQKGINSPKGFTINTGCDCPPNTPIENVYAYLRAAKQCAKYPFSYENLEW